MVKVALFVRLEAKPGKETDVANFLKSALAMANQEATTPVWFALRLGPSTFGIFDAFADEAGRSVHLAGPIAAALGIAENTVESHLRSIYGKLDITTERELFLRYLSLPGER